MKKLLMLSAVAVMFIGGVNLAASETEERYYKSSVSVDDERGEKRFKGKCDDCREEEYTRRSDRNDHEKGERAHKRWHKKHDRCDREHAGRSGHDKKEHTHRGEHRKFDCDKRHHS